MDRTLLELHARAFTRAPIRRLAPPAADIALGKLTPRQRTTVVQRTAEDLIHVSRLLRTHSARLHAISAQHARECQSLVALADRLFNRALEQLTELEKLAR